MQRDRGLPVERPQLSSGYGGKLGTIMGPSFSIPTQDTRLSHASGALGRRVPVGELVGPEWWVLQPMWG
jgi:hypothetical protein